MKMVARVREASVPGDKRLAGGGVVHDRLFCAAFDVGQLHGRMELPKGMVVDIVITPHVEPKPVAVDERQQS